MSIYKGFAAVYDEYMDNVPYVEWADYLERIFTAFNLKPKIILDLCCGTGNMTVLLDKRGYDMIGLDVSEEMLDAARAKSSGNILYICQDMRGFELYGTVDAVICLCDSINYILDINELVKVFKLVSLYLNNGGLFIFDINTVHKFRNILGDGTFAEVSDDSAFIWDNYYDETGGVNEFQTTFFVRDDKTDMYTRYDEIHNERAYTVDEIRNAIGESGLEFCAVYGECGFDPPDENSERIFFVVKKGLDG